MPEIVQMMPQRDVPPASSPDESGS